MVYHGQLIPEVMADPGAGCAFMPSYPKPVGGAIDGSTCFDVG